MKYIPNKVSRFASVSLLKVSAKSPTILVVSGVIGLGATAFLAAKATRKIDPILEVHADERVTIDLAELAPKDEQRALLDLYVRTGVKFGKLYGPALFVGTASAISVLGGHRILVGRHVASMAAYSGLFQEFNAYRKRVSSTFGEDHERAIYDGATLHYEEDPAHKGEYKLAPKYPEIDPNRDTYLRPWFDETNPNFTRDAQNNFMFLQGVQAHLNRVLNTRGYVFLNDVFDDLRIPRTPEGQSLGWFRDDDIGDDYIDFGFMSGNDPHTIAFRNHAEKTVQLNFNVDGDIWHKIGQLNIKR
jgi:hypothetical protein